MPSPGSASPASSIPIRARNSPATRSPLCCGITGSRSAWMDAGAATTTSLSSACGPLLRGDVADIDGGLAQILASDGWLPDRPINVPVYMAAQGPKARALAKEITDGLISLGGPAEGFDTCLVSTNGTVLDDGEDVTSPRASTALKPLVALAYHHRYTTDPESVKALPSGEAWLASVARVDENAPHPAVHLG